PGRRSKASVTTPTQKAAAAFAGAAPNPALDSGPNRAVGAQVVRPAVVRFRRAVLGRHPARKLVEGKRSKRPGLIWRGAEAPGDEIDRLQRVALGLGLVAHAGEVVRLVGDCVHLPGDHERLLARHAP